MPVSKKHKPNLIREKWLMMDNRSKTQGVLAVLGMMEI